MNARALLLFALLAAPAWAQEPSFDLKSESIRNIVKATAATQFGQVQAVEKAVVERKPDPVIDLASDERIEEQPVVKPGVPDRAPPPRQGPISALLDVLLHAEPDTSSEGLYTEWLACQQHDDQASTTRRFETCPGRSSAAPAPGAPTIYTPPVNH